MFKVIKNDWIKDNKNIVGSFSLKNEVVILNKKFKVGDNGVKQSHNEREIEIGKLFADKYNVFVEMLPDITGAKEQQNIRMADCLMNGIPYEMKRIYGSGKYTIMHAIRNAKGQANNIILDIINDIENKIIEENIEKIYKNRFCAFVDICVILKKDNIINIYKRK